MVEDDAATAAVVQEYLKEEGFAVDVAASGAAAVIRFKRRPADLLIIDYQLPDMTGVEVVRRCTEVSSNFCVVFLTAYALQPSHLAGMTVKHTILQKPCKPAAILQAVKKLAA